jgi:hypothetical protein
VKLSHRARSAALDNESNTATLHVPCLILTNHVSEARP